MEKPASTPPDPVPRADAGAGRSIAVRRVDVRDLLGEARELVIVHAGREYRLRVTANGKLLLTA